VLYNHLFILFVLCGEIKFIHMIKMHTWELLYPRERIVFKFVCSEDKKCTLCVCVLICNVCDKSRCAVM